MELWLGRAAQLALVIGGVMCRQYGSSGTVTQGIQLPRYAVDDFQHRVEECERAQQGAAGVGGLWQYVLDFWISVEQLGYQSRCTVMSSSVQELR
jgi:hypothetical protein